MTWNINLFIFTSAHWCFYSLGLYLDSNYEKMNSNCKKNLVNKRIRCQIWSPIVLEVIIAIYLLPVTVIDQLDSMKKESSNARDAIRWLEAEFRKGNMWVFWVWGVRAPAGNMSNGVISSAYSVYISVLGCVQF